MRGTSFPVRGTGLSQYQRFVSQNGAADPSSERLESENGVDIKRRIRIGFVLHVMQVAGAEMLVAEIVRRAEEVFEPTIICLDGIGPLGEQLRHEGVDVVNLDRRPGRDYRVACAHGSINSTAGD